MPYTGGELLGRDSRRAARTISRYQAQTQVRVAGTDQETDVSLAKLESSTAVTGQAMAAVVRVAQLQKQLETLAPEASGRLSMLADGHAISLVEIAADHQRTLRRR
jgi:hypothetical protein